jgi:hypothetical protein
LDRKFPVGIPVATENQTGDFRFEPSLGPEPNRASQKHVWAWLSLSGPKLGYNRIFPVGFPVRFPVKPEIRPRTRYSSQTFFSPKELEILFDQKKRQVGKGVWLARNQTHESIETTPLNSAVLSMNSSKIIREWEKHRHFAPK